jgi:hypothetical protein
VEAQHLARRDSPAGRSSSMPASHRRVLQPGASDRDLLRAALIRALPNSTEQLRSGRTPTHRLAATPTRPISTPCFAGGHLLGSLRVGWRRHPIGLPPISCAPPDGIHIARRGPASMERTASLLPHHKSPVYLHHIRRRHESMNACTYHPQAASPCSIIH